ncbi:AMP-binding protein [Gordonia sp. NB41Y]|uniref:AMP-binding protein n=1 Tax=Gordonia sp. NB41Y TaxID=875808 RepID=UPI0006B15178|nr:AMP-binding protein [Gordonia sp. NB41Y]EMP11812.2 acyl-CoA synthetase [Gordonia sp. NB41Y]WLP89593.1 AMP-binding protein [Gordonia sp. NB41Y]
MTTTATTSPARAASPVHAVADRARSATWLTGVLVRSGFLGPARPDRYLRMGLTLRRHGGPSPVSGIGLAAARTPEDTALIDECGSLTWAELDARADALAAGLADLLGPRSGEQPPRIAIMCRNHRGLVESLAATSRLGADAILLNTGFAGPQFAEVIAREGAELLIVDDEFAALVAEAVERVPRLRCLRAWIDDAPVTPDTAATSDTPATPDTPVTPNAVGTLESVISGHAGRRAPRPARAGRVVLLTSGTTGTPKGARRGGSTDVASLAAILDRIPWRAGESMVIAAPIFHAWGFGQVAIAATMSVTMIMRRRFDPLATMELVERHRATGLAVVPVMFERIMDLPASVLDTIDVPSLRFVTASGSRMRADAVQQFMNRFGEVIYNSYNATEAGLISTATPADLRTVPDTAGRPLVGTDVRILDDDGDEVPTGGIGRIVVAGNSGFDGYTTADTKDFAGRHMVSGDLGYLDAAGRLFVVGRDDEMIVSGGENVYPLEVEQTLSEHPAVADVAVIGVDDEKFGQRLAAFVVGRPEQAVDPGELRDHVRCRLAGFKVPRDVHVIDELPRNATGKILKRVLADDLRRVG